MDPRSNKQGCLYEQQIEAPKDGVELWRDVIEGDPVKYGRLD